MDLHLADRVIANAEGTPPRIATTVIGAGYFEALGLTMPRGREFTPADGAPGAEAVIVNQRFAAQYWPGEDPVGQKIRLGQGPWSTVVGVSPTIRQTSLRPDVDALVYLPFRQVPTFWFSIMARVRSPASAANVLREEVRKLDPDLPLLDMRTLDEYLDRLTWRDENPQHAVFRVCADRSPPVRCRHLRRHGLRHQPADAGNRHPNRAGGGHS